MPYGVLALSLFGTGQQAVQRFLSCTDLGAARRAALTGWAAGTVTLGLTLFLGVCLYSWSKLAPAGADFAAAKGDEVLPRFIALRLPAGVAGLMLAAIFAASMSSLDSAIHSMSTVTIVDFLRRFGRRKQEAGTELLIARFGTVLFGLLAVAGALYAAEASTQILETMVTWLGYFAGPLLGLFLLGMLTKRATERSALLGVGVAFAAEIAVLSTAGPKPWGFHPLWLAPGSFAVTFLVGWLAAIPRDGAKAAHESRSQVR
ncbi:MAG: sodium:solute symporter family transporter [Planctomycetota bacterium]